MGVRSAVLVIVLAGPLFVVACSGALGPSAPPFPSGSPVPTVGPLPTPAGSDLSLAELKYRLLDTFAPLHYCDPDEYPVPRGDEGQKAIEIFPTIRADAETFGAILARLALTGTADFTADQKLALYRQWKQLNAIVLTPADGRFGFDLLTESNPGLGQGIRSTGKIDRRGTITIENREQAFLYGCPICLARSTQIDTPRGPVAVQDLRVGDPVWTVNGFGERVAGVVVALGSAAVPPAHRVVHLVLSDGRELWASPGHPLADDRRLGELRSGDPVDGGRVVSAELVAYGSSFTYDLLPSGPTALYWADGILLGSTLGR